MRKMRNTFVLNLANGYECLFFFILESAPNIQQTEKSLRKTTELSQQEHVTTESNLSLLTQMSKANLLT